MKKVLLTMLGSIVLLGSADGMKKARRMSAALGDDAIASRVADLENKGVDGDLASDLVYGREALKSFLRDQNVAEENEATYQYAEDIDMNKVKALKAGLGLNEEATPKELYDELKLQADPNALDHENVNATEEYFGAGQPIIPDSVVEMVARPKSASEMLQSVADNNKQLAEEKEQLADNNKQLADNNKRLAEEKEQLAREKGDMVAKDDMRGILGVASKTEAWKKKNDTIEKQAAKIKDLEAALAEAQKPTEDQVKETQENVDDDIPVMKLESKTPEQNAPKAQEPAASSPKTAKVQEQTPAPNAPKAQEPAAPSPKTAKVQGKPQKPTAAPRGAKNK